MSQTIESHLEESRRFSPPAAFSQDAQIGSLEAYQTLYAQSISDPEAFWADQAEALEWDEKWSNVLEWKAPDAKWFVGGKLNVCVNCVDRHLATHRRDKTAILWEGEPEDDSQDITYAQLHEKVCRLANVLEKHEVEAGDRVIIYMPMVPEAAVAMLACARIGAVHSVIFGGFSADSIADRLEDCQPKLILTADGGYRRGSVVPLKENVDLALKRYGGVEKVLVHKRCGNDVTLVAGRDLWWHEECEAVSAEHTAKSFDSEHPLFILYTSGSTGKPKGILHTTGGYLLGAYTTCKYIFDMKDSDVYWCTADVGWITGHSYIVYGPLANGVTQVMYEGAPNAPDFGRFWKIVEKYKVSLFYTAPTAIRAFIKAGDHFPAKHDLSSLRLLGSVGEPINPEAWMWYREKIGGEKCPIVDTWWQTETGSIAISPLPGAMETQPGTATFPFFGIDAAIFDESGNECGPNEGGKLVIRQPWPSMLRSIYRDHDRYVSTYWSDYEGVYTAGDGARRDEQGNFWIVGRLDDVLNVSGHRLGTAEVESALVAHAAVAEAAVVGAPHEIKGQAVICFVTLKSDIETSPELQKELRNHVGQVIGAIAKPDAIHFAPALPKTRSGKIMRRVLKELAATGEVTGNLTTLEDMTVIEQIQRSMAS